MPKELMKRLEKIQKELETVLNKAKEDDFANFFYYTDFQLGLHGAIARIKTTLFNASI